MIVGLMPILPKFAVAGQGFSPRPRSIRLVGSGPYVMEKIKAGETISYKQEP